MDVQRSPIWCHSDPQILEIFLKNDIVFLIVYDYRYSIDIYIFIMIKKKNIVRWALNKNFTYVFRARLHDLFTQIEKEFEGLYLDNLNCKYIYAIVLHLPLILFYLLKFRVLTE